MSNKLTKQQAESLLEAWSTLTSGIWNTWDTYAYHIANDTAGHKMIKASMQAALNMVPLLKLIMTNGRRVEVIELINAAHQYEISRGHHFEFYGKPLTDNTTFYWVPETGEMNREEVA